MKRTFEGVATKGGTLAIQAYRFDHLILHRPFKVRDTPTGPVVELEKNGWILTHRGTGRRVVYFDDPFSRASKLAAWADEHGSELWARIDTGTAATDRAVLKTIAERILPVLKSTRASAEDAIRVHG